MTTVVIDLGLERGEPETYGSPTRPTNPWWFSPAVLVVAVLLFVTASAAPAAPGLSRLMTVEIGPADPYTMTDDGLLYAQTLGTVAAFALDDGRQLWQTGVDNPAYRLLAAGGLVMQRPTTISFGREPSTSALSSADGSRKWVRAGNVITVEGSPTLLSVSNVRSSAPGRRIRGTVDAVDPATGRTRWQVRIPGSAVLMTIPAEGDRGPRMLLVHDDRHVALHDLVTGAELTRGDLPAADYGPDNPVMIGGLLILRYPTDHGRVVTAYDPDTFQQLWSRPAGNSFGIAACGDHVCLTGSDGVRAVGLLDGGQRWFRAGWRGIEGDGAALIAYGTPERETAPVGIVDPDSGAILTTLTGWSPVDRVGGGPVLVTRTTDEGRRTMVAVADPADPQPRLLGELPPGSSDCRSAPGRLVCRSVDGELTMWAYRSGR